MGDKCQVSYMELDLPFPLFEILSYFKKKDFLHESHCFDVIAHIT